MVGVKDKNGVITHFVRIPYQGEEGPYDKMVITSDGRVMIKK